jgi:hypothetical protein
MSTVSSPTGRRLRRSVDSANASATHAKADRRAYLVVLLLLSLLAWAPLLYPGYFQVHSGFLPLFNLADLAATSGKLAWLPTVGVTPDLLRGEGPLAYWLALLLRPLAGELGAVKATFALSIIAAGMGVYTWTRRSLTDFAGQANDMALQGLLTRRSGLLAAMVAMLWPPLLATVYVRGALAEALFMALLPWALWAVSRVRSAAPNATPHPSPFTDPAARIALSALLVAALFWTQAGLALWAAGLLLVWALWPGATPRSRGLAAGAVAGGALLGGGLFLLLHRGPGLPAPALDVAGHAVYLYQLLSSAWGFGVSTSGWQDGLPLQLGFAALSLALLTLILGFTGRPRPPITDHRTPITSLTFAAVAALLLILLTTTLARPLWRVDLLAATVRYPWQLFALVGPLLALLAGAVVVVERRLAVLPVWAAAVALVALSSYPYLAPRFTQVLPNPVAPMIFGANQVTLVTGTVRDRPEQAEAGTVGDRPEQAEAGTVRDRPEQAEAGTVRDRPEQGEAGTVGDRPEQAEAGTVGDRPEQAEAGTVRDRPEQAEAGTVGDRPEQAEAGTVGDRPEQAEAGTVGDRPEQDWPEQDWPEQDWPEQATPLAPSPSEGEGWGEGDSLPITLAWQALQPIDFDYNVFIHALDAAGNRVAQWDGQPLRAGEPAPMTTWGVGEIVSSVYRLELDPAAAPVQRVLVGLYNWQTGERLLVNGSDGVTLEVGP